MHILASVFFRNKTDDYLYLYIRNLENSRLKSAFRYTISICICGGREENTKWILCCQKIGVKCAYLKLLMYIQRLF